MSEVRLSEKSTAPSYDAIDLYRREMNRFPLLTIEQERELAKHSLKDPETQRKLVEHNLRLVWRVARCFLWSGMDMIDLVQEGNMGLMTAAKKYDYRKGAKFSTYATWWIRSFVRRAAMEQSGTIHVPINTWSLRRNVTLCARKLTEDLGRRPTEPEIAKSLGISQKRVRTAIASNMAKTVSLSDPLSESSDDGGQQKPIEHIIADQNSMRPEVLIDAHKKLVSAKERIKKMLRTLKDTLDLSERNIEIFAFVYGLGDSGEKHSLKTTGDVFGLTRERIRQIIGKTWEQINSSDSDINVDQLKEVLAIIERLKELVE